jgi:hypothetical protein
MADINKLARSREFEARTNDAEQWLKDIFDKVVACVEKMKEKE